jgi:protocatechuate 3,4-dioxygenase alpha subunit
MTARSPLTPAQTVGPFLAIGLDWGELGACAADPNMDGVIRVGGRLLDGQGATVGDGLIETWQVRPDGFARCLTDPDGAWEVVTLKPEPLPGPDDATEAPHLDVSVFARGLLHRVVTRIYFADEAEANAADPVLTSLDNDARSTLIAIPDEEGRYRLDIHLSGDAETVFFRV